MIEPDLKSRERNLARDQEEWDRSYTDRERKRGRLAAEIEVLEPRADKIRQTVAELKHEQELAEAAVHRLNNDISVAVDRLADIKADIGRLNVMREKQLTEAETRKQELYMKYLAYEEVKKDQFEEFLHDITNEIDGKNQQLTELDAAIAKSEQLRVSADEVLVAARDARNAAISELAEEEEILQADIAKIRSSNQHLRSENSTLLATNNQLKLSNVELEGAHAKFSAYEKKAIAKLEMVDKSLREREQTITEREQHRTPIKSFLPPVD